MTQSRLTKDLQGFCKHIDNIKKEYWERDKVAPGHTALLNTSILTVIVMVILNRKAVTPKNYSSCSHESSC